MTEQDEHIANLTRLAIRSVKKADETATPDAAAAKNVYATLALATAVQELTRQPRVLAGMVESTRGSLDGVRRKMGSDR